MSRSRTVSNNPFTPGFGDADVWVDRPAEMAVVRAMADRAHHGALQGARLIEQERGYGKTTLLQAVEDRLADGWDPGGIAIRATAVEGESFVASLSIRMEQAIRHAATFGEDVAARVLESLGRIREVRLAGVVGVRADDVPVSDLPPSVALTQSLVDLGEAARQVDQAVLVLVDEAQSIDGASLRALFTAWQTVSTTRDANGRVPPLALLLAGLPGTRASFKKHRVTFGERTRDLPFGPLEDDAIRATLQRFVEFNELGVGFEPAAIDRMVTVVEGHPHVFQLVGEGAWLASPHVTSITATDIDRGLASSRRERSAIAGARLADLTDAQMAWARAAASIPEAERTLTAVCRVHRGDDAATAANCGSLAAALFDRGVVRRTEHGRIAFALRAIEDHLAP